MVSAAEQLAANLNFSALAKAEELKKRIWFTLAALIVYRIGTYIPVPGVDAAVDQYSAPDRELLAVLQLFGKDHRICFRYEIKEGPKVFETVVRGKKFEMYNDTIIGYAKDGTKIIETTVEEPLHLRPEKHANSI